MEIDRERGAIELHKPQQPGARALAGSLSGDARGKRFPDCRRAIRDRP